jgi:hypothetical protein
MTNMDIRAIVSTLPALLLVATLGGCSDADTGPYAEAKNDWDSPPTTEKLQDMRLRLSTTQQDH